MSDNLRRTFIFRGIAFAVVYIGVELLIALGLVIVGAGIGAAANAVRRIGQFTLRAVELMGRLIRLMRRTARKAWELAEELADRARDAIQTKRRRKQDHERTVGPSDSVGQRRTGHPPLGPSDSRRTGRTVGQDTHHLVDSATTAS